MPLFYWVGGHATYLPLIVRQGMPHTSPLLGSKACRIPLPYCAVGHAAYLPLIGQ